MLHGWVEIVSREQMRWDIDILRPPVNICCGQRLRHCKQAGGVPVSRPIPQNTPQAAGMVQGKQGRKVVGTGHAPAGPVVFHPVPNNREDVALHAPAPGGLLALVGQWRLFSFPLVVRHQCVFVAAEVGKQFPPFLLFVRVQCAFNGCLHHSKGFLYLAFTQ